MPVARRRNGVMTYTLGAKRRLHRIGRELALIAGAGLAYSLVRGLTDDRVDEAFDNAEKVVDAERSAGVFVEPAVQDAALGSGFLTDLANAIYISYWPFMLLTLGWLLIWRPGAYPLYRNAVLASGGFALVLFALFPLAPPRFLPHHGFADTIALYSDGYREFNASALVNEYAAMPSLHFGWVLLAAIAVYRLARRPEVRVLAAAAPVAMLWAIVATGNHYLVDALGGGLVVLAGLGVARLIQRRRTRSTTPFDDIDDPHATGPRQVVGEVVGDRGATRRDEALTRRDAAPAEMV